MIWTILVSTVLVVITVTMMTLVIKEIRISSNIDESTRAYMAAEAGMERAFYKISEERKKDIDWCRDLNINEVLDSDPDRVLRYEAKIECKDSGQKEIEINSDGFSRETTRRKLKTNLTNPKPSIDRFDTDPNITNDGYYDPAPRPTGPISTSPLIVQQFDLFELTKLGMGESNEFIVGMSDGGNTDFGVKFAKKGPLIEVSLTGRINSPNNNIPLKIFNLTPVASDYYRVKLEYSKQGSYTVVRAIILKRNPGEQANFVCINDKNSYVVYTGVDEKGANPTLVKISNGSYNSANQNIDLGPSNNAPQLDNMAFWGRD